MALRRKRVELEGRLVSEWVASTHPRATVHLRTWLGPLPEESEALKAQGISPRMYEVLGKWADAVVLYPSRAIIVEGKLKLAPHALGQLLVYYELFGKTARFREWWERPREMICLYAIPDHSTLEALHARGIQSVQYAPPWAKRAYIERARRSYRRG